MFELSMSEQLIRIEDERLRITSSGTRRREYLIVTRGQDGVERREWVDEHGIIAGDSIYAFRQQRGKMLRDASIFPAARRRSACLVRPMSPRLLLGSNGPKWFMKW